MNAVTQAYLAHLIPPSCRPKRITEHMQGRYHNKEHRGISRRYRLMGSIANS
jgi:hypothetical protein